MIIYSTHVINKLIECAVLADGSFDLLSFIRLVIYTFSEHVPISTILHNVGVAL